MSTNKLLYLLIRYQAVFRRRLKLICFANIDKLTQRRQSCEINSDMLLHTKPSIIENKGTGWNRKVFTLYTTGGGVDLQFIALFTCIGLLAVSSCWNSFSIALSYNSDCAAN